MKSNVKQTTARWAMMTAVLVSAVSVMIVHAGFGQHCQPIAGVFLDCGPVNQGCPGTCQIVTTSQGTPSSAGNCAEGGVFCGPFVQGAKSGTASVETRACGVEGWCFPDCNCNGLVIKTTTITFSYTCQ